MNILILVDKKGSAIDRLDQSIKKYNPHFDIRILDFHPKRPDLDQLENALPWWQWADIIHITYWKSGEKFKEMYPELWKNKRKILSHHNPYDLQKKDWQEDYKKIVVSNNSMHDAIPYAHLIPQGIDLDFWEYQEEYTKNKTVLMVVARIESKKGIREVAKVCKELGYKFILVGRISKMNYFKQIKEVNPDMEFRENITDEELKKTYYESAIHVCNSIDNFESGTMPILESMACGVPVLTRIVGHVPELYDEQNLEIIEGQPEDYESLKKKLKDFMDNSALRAKMREKAWQTVKLRPAQKMARMYSTLYYQTASKDPLVSVIMPTFDKPNVLAESLAKVVVQDYRNFEIIVVDSGNTSIKKLIDEFRKEVFQPIKYIRFDNKGEYTLAKARNMAAIEAEGKYLVFCDERIGMESDVISIFVSSLKNNPDSKVWIFGMKDDVEKGFVENLSIVSREQFIDLGMFNERIDCYGGMTQDIKTRFERNGFVFERVNAKAYSVAGTKSHRRKKEIVRSKYNIWKMYS